MDKKIEAPGKEMRNIKNGESDGVENGSIGGVIQSKMQDLITPNFSTFPLSHTEVGHSLGVK